MVDSYLPTQTGTLVLKAIFNVPCFSFYKFFYPDNLMIHLLASASGPDGKRLHPAARIHPIHNDLMFHCNATLDRACRSCWA
jgi:hypothetical protein